jgi:hypothetical protein
LGQHGGDRVAQSEAALGERRAQPAGARVGFLPGEAPIAVHHRDALRVDISRALDERQRRQRRVVGGVLVELLLVGIGLGAHDLKV